MEMTRALKFETPSFTKRLRGMLGVDFYRLFHTPMFYIFLVIAAIIPAMILGTSGSDTAEGVASCLYTQIPESRINTELFNHHQKTEYPYNHTENAF